jgi:aspartate racemase
MDPAPGRGADRRAPRVIGVLGGMGPLATADFYTKLVRLTPAKDDRDHPRVIIDSNAAIPDRTEALLGGGPDPTPALMETARTLERAGAELIAIPCNTAHAFLAAIRQAVSVPVLDIMDEVARRAAALKPAPGAVGLLATDGTLRLRLYHTALAARGIDTVEPTTDDQAALMEAIHRVKAGALRPDVRAAVRGIGERLVARGGAALVLGCTELPLVLGPRGASVAVLDGTEILARAALRDAFAREFSAPSGRSFNDTRAHIEIP